MDDIKEIKRKIKIAQEYALEHFNAAGATDINLIDIDDNGEMHWKRPSFFVDFPDVDRMIVTPSIMGQRSFASVEYRLHFRKDGNVVWKGKSPLTGDEIGKIFVEVK